MPLIRLMYASHSSINSDSALLDSILRKARTNNKLLQVSGVLLYDHGAFLQVLEGERDTVNKLYLDICRDTRHCEPIIISYENIQERMFGFWEMGQLTADDLERYQLRYHSSSDQFDPYNVDRSIIYGLKAMMDEKEAGDLPAAS